MDEALLGDVLLVQRVAFDGEAQEHADCGEGQQRHPYDSQSVRVGLHELRSGVAGGHLLDDAHDGSRLSAVLVGHGREFGNGEQLLLEGILEDHAADGNADTLTCDTGQPAVPPKKKGPQGAFSPKVLRKE